MGNKYEKIISQNFTMVCLREGARERENYQTKSRH